MPENGARIVLRSMVARISRIRASACLCAAAAVSNSARETASCSTRLFIRSKVRRDSSSCASAAASCACSCLVSSWTRTSPSLDRPSRVERDPFDDAGQVGADGDALNGLDGADRVEGGGPLLALGHDRRDRFGRRLHRGELRRHRLELLDFDKRQRRDEDGHHHQHQNHPLRHCVSSQLLHSSARSISGCLRGSRLHWRPSAAERAIQLHDRRQLALPKPRELELALEQIALRVEHGQVAVEPALIALGRQLRRLAQRLDQPFLLVALLAASSRSRRASRTRPGTRV